MTAVGVALTLLGSTLGWLAKEFMDTRDTVIRHELRIIVIEDKIDPMGPPVPINTDEEGR